MQLMSMHPFEQINHIIHIRWMGLDRIRHKRPLQDIGRDDEAHWKFPTILENK